MWPPSKRVRQRRWRRNGRTNHATGVLNEGMDVTAQLFDLLGVVDGAHRRVVGAGQRRLRPLQRLVVVAAREGVLRQEEAVAGAEIAPAAKHCRRRPKQVPNAKKKRNDNETHHADEASVMVHTLHPPMNDFPLPFMTWRRERERESGSFGTAKDDCAEAKESTPKHEKAEMENDCNDVNDVTDWVVSEISSTKRYLFLFSMWIAAENENMRKKNKKKKHDTNGRVNE